MFSIIYSKVRKKRRKMKAVETRNIFLNYFKEKGHTLIPSAPVVPEGDSSVLFTTAGMQPIIPYLLRTKTSRRE